MHSRFGCFGISSARTLNEAGFLPQTTHQFSTPLSRVWIWESERVVCGVFPYVFVEGRGISHFPYLDLLKAISQMVVFHGDESHGIENPWKITN